MHRSLFISGVPTRAGRSIANLALAGCCADGVHSVDVSLGSDGMVFPSYVWVGDTLTVFAVAGTELREFCYHQLYSSQEQPGRFAYRSADTLVATVSERGFLLGRAIGTKYLTSASAGIVSERLPVIVAPPITGLRLTATPESPRVGDTLVVSVNAVDDRGSLVAGAQITFELTRPFDSVATFLSPPRGQAPSITISTPTSLRLRALRPGSLTVLIRAPRDIPRPRRGVADSVVVRIVPDPSS